MRILALVPELAFSCIEELALATVELCDLGPEILVDCHALGLAFALALLRAGLHDRWGLLCRLGLGFGSLAEPPALAAGHGTGAMRHIN